MRPPTRTIALGLLIALLVITAGCSAFQNGTTPSDTVHLVNQDESSHAVVVEIHRGMELVYSAGRTLDAESAAELDPFTTNGEYRVAVTVDGNTTEKTYTFPRDDSATTIGIDTDGKVTIGT